MKILVYLTGGLHWMGGIQYTRNLLRAISLLPLDARPDIVLQVGRKNSGQGFEEEFSRYPNVVIDGPINGHNALKSMLLNRLRRVWKKLFGSDIPGKILLSDECTVAFPAKGPNIPGRAQKVYWVPDFQYKHYPEYFTDDERKKRDEMYDEMFSEQGILVLSSEAAKIDFYRYFPKHGNKDVRVLHFVTTLVNDEYRPDPAQVCARYALPEKFIYLPNQMWQHKGFDTTFLALGILKRQGMDIPLVCTGNAVDYRSTDYSRHLQNLIEKNNLERQIYMLGILPRLDQLQLFRRAALILQPSRFEGWSTAVEDARALGKYIVLSDIVVHREQAPTDAAFFTMGDEADLATKLSHAWAGADTGPDLVREATAREAAEMRGNAYAKTFLSIMAAASYGLRGH